MPNILTKSLRNKFLVLLLSVSLIPIMIVGYMSYSSGKKIIKDRLLNNLMSIAKTRESAILLVLRAKAGRTIDFASDGFIRNSVRRINKGEDGSVIDALNKHLLKNKMPLDKAIYGIDIIDTRGHVIASTIESEIGLDVSQNKSFVKARGLDYGKAYTSDIFISNLLGAKGIPLFTSSVPLTDKKTGKKLGVIVNYYDTKILNEITTNREGIGETGEVYLVNRDGLMITESRFISDAVLKQRVDTRPVRLFRDKKKIMTGVYPNYRGVKVIGASMGDDIGKEFPLGWTILVEQEEGEVYAPINSLGSKIVWFAVFVAIFVVFIAYFVAGTLTTPIMDVSNKIARVASGDLTVDITSEKGEDEIGVLKESLMVMVENNRKQINKILEGINLLSSSSSEILATTSQLSSSAAQTSVSINETTTTVEEVKQTAQVTDEKASHVSDNAKQAIETSREGKKSVDDTIAGMKHISTQMTSIAENILTLSEHSQSIGEIIAAVDDLSEQSNLLAVNAAIEAAKAGEHGKGFAVVAQEIRRLAQQSKEATAHVRSVLNDIQKATNSAVLTTEQGSKAVESGLKQANSTGEAIEILTKSIDEAAHASIQIAASNRQLLVGIEQVASAMESIRQASAQNVDSAKNLEDSARGLDDLGAGLKELVRQYRV